MEYEPLQSQMIIDLIDKYGPVKFGALAYYTISGKDPKIKVDKKDWEHLKYGYTAMNHSAKSKRKRNIINYDDLSDLPEWEQDQKKLKNNLDTNKLAQKTTEYENIKENVAKQHAGINGSPAAKRDLEKLKLNKGSKQSQTKNLKDEAYYRDLDTENAKFVKKLNDEKEFSQKNGDTKMEISRKDLTKIMTAMKTLQKHFAEEQAPVAQSEETVEDETTTADNEETDVDNLTEDNVSVELPEDVVDQLREALNDQAELDNEDAETDEDEVVVETDDTETEVPVDEEEEGLAACGTDDFYEFAESITFATEKLTNDLDQIKKQLSDGMTDKYEDDFIESFSMKDYRQFAENVVTALENIQARVTALGDANAKTEDDVTTDVSGLAEDMSDKYEEGFITTTDDTSTAEEPIVQEQGASVVNAPQAFSTRYQKVKDFLTL